ncbi:arsenate reductase ArsC [Labilibaculum sp. A4]|uniref:arsenate reductase/protein-tyrosine-phosphatase family protein n=1 Tax=Labilibaculum euxinus TaxID=2686357 RepID=UPI000F625128|nr:arsenate reductase ArsC [Labilibaculum euxinus]MWN78422.1 arsenate reductase ArsC [Labilibaculum euxinus]
MVKKVLVLSDKNVARSQMAEKWLNYYGKRHIEVWSAGLEKGSIQVLAQKAMAEAIMDIPEYKSKALDELNQNTFDFVLCFDKEVENKVPVLNGNPKILLFELPDPANVEGEENVRLQAYNAVCNAVDDICFSFVQDNFQIVE